MEKWPILDQNNGLTPFQKSQFFAFFKLLVFVTQKHVFSFQNIVKHFFVPYIAKKQNMEKWPILDQKHGLTPLQKSQFYHFLSLLSLWPRKPFFRSRISQNTFSCPILPKKKDRKNGQFWTKNHGLTPLQKSHFFHFLNLLFLQPRKAFFRSRIS